jgi:hypothetical protein
MGKHDNLFDEWLISLGEMEFTKNYLILMEPRRTNLPVYFVL